MTQAKSGNVFNDPVTGKPLNPENVLQKDGTQTTGFNLSPEERALVASAAKGSGVATLPPVSESSGVREADEEGRPIDAAAESQANAADTIASIGKLAQAARSGNRAAVTMLETVRTMEQARQGGPRQSVLRRLEQAKR